MAIRIPERISSEFVLPFVLRTFNSTSQDSFRPEISLNFKTGLKANAVLFLGRLMDEKTIYTFHETIRNEEIYNPVKGFYPIFLIEFTSTFNYFDIETDFRLKPGDKYLSIHLGERKARRRHLPQITYKNAVEAMGKVASYIEKNKERLPNNPVIGISYDRLAHVSTKFGFTVSVSPLPTDVKNNLTKSLKKSKDRTGDYDVQLVFQPYEHLIARFKKPSSKK